jgi:RNA polymerase sigma-70 factor (ECF subfamily)
MPIDRFMLERPPSNDAGQYNEHNPKVKSPAIRVKDFRDGLGIRRAGVEDGYEDEMAASTEQFVRLFAQHDRELYRYVLTLVGDEAAAEDVMQEVAADLWRKWGQYDASQPFGAWARSFAKVQVMRHRRTRLRDRVVFSDAVLERIAEDREAEQPGLDARRKALRRCLGELPDGDRRLLEARYESGGTMREAAQRSGQPAKKLYTALDRIRRALMRCIDRRLDASGAEVES